MSADIAVVISMLLVMGVIVAKLATTHRIAAGKAELIRLTAEREAAVEKLNTAKGRRVAAEDNRDFMVRRRDEQLLRRSRLVYELEEIAGVPHEPPKVPETGTDEGMEPA